MLAEFRKRSQITLPSFIAKKLHLKAGDLLDVDMEEDKIIIKPVIAVAREQAYFWTEKWQEEEKRVDREIKAGKIKSAATPKKLYKDLGL
ncbi:MAG: AbrB/MazE/SpoVT family DNA-binding domain-containing protein [bacterium]